MIYAICNPTAGHGRGKKVGRMIEEWLREKQRPCRLLWTEYPGHGTELARKAGSEGAEMVIAIGGDGTAFETAQGLLGTETPLAIIPAGTGNDFIKTIGVPSDPKEALEHVLSCKPQKTDAGMINDRMFLNEIGTGFDVMVLDYTQKAKKYARGLLPYLYGVLQAMFRFRAMEITYTLEDGEEMHQRAFVMAAANGGYIGGGIRIAPDARVDDGLLDVVVVGDIPRRKLPLRLLGLLRGKILSFPETQFHRVKMLTFTAENMRLNIDGEVISAQAAQVTIMPGSIWICR